MRITTLTIQNYRSIRDLTLQDIGQTVILYGPNGAGKSNLLVAARHILLAVNRTEPGFYSKDYRDLDQPITISATLSDGTSSWRAEVVHPAHSQAATPEVRGQLTIRGESDFPKMPDPEFIGAPRNSTDARSGYASLAQLLFQHKNSPEIVHRRRFRHLQSFLSGPPLNRPPFDVVDSRLDRWQIREELGDVSDLPLDSKGLGIEQIYVILGRLVLADHPIAMLEEPEAHLHAPSSGQHLRSLLVRLLAESQVQQLWIATHSNLFDLDPECYYDVGLQDPALGTQVERRPLGDIDLRHLYEPGPAKHALLEQMRLLDPDGVTFYSSRGEPVTTREMIRMLQNDDPLAIELLRDLTSSALRSVRLQAQKKLRASQ